ncbi:hypothetical protein [Microbispora sp. NPDC049633]|uniref:hypothetical protein n=1 Tax=Microbispora sp. NPDC049633 TaxID=3154355 RepID=UPI0034361565
MSDRGILHYEFYIDEQQITPGPLEVVLKPSIANNTVAQVQVLYHGPGQMKKRLTLPKQGTPVRLVWGKKPSQLKTWYGYIAHSEPTGRLPGGRYGNTIVTHVLVGNSHQLRAEKTRRWEEVTDSGIAKQLASEYGLSLVAHRTSKVYPYLYQHGISDMDWLRERAKASGRQLWIENGTLYFTDPASLALATTSTPVKGLMNRSRNRADNVHDAEPLVGSLVPVAGKQANRQLTGLDIEANEFLYDRSAADEPAPEWVRRNTAITSVSDLYQTSDAVKIENEQWLQAHITLHGEVEAIPGNLFELTGKAVPQTLEGRWLITDATQILRTRDSSGNGQRWGYECEVTVARNREDNLALRDTTMPKVNDACTLAGGRWIARSRREVLL